MQKQPGGRSRKLRNHILNYKHKQQANWKWSKAMNSKPTHSGMLPSARLHSLLRRCHL